MGGVVLITMRNEHEHDDDDVAIGVFKIKK